MKLFFGTNQIVNISKVVYCVSITFGNSLSVQMFHFRRVVLHTFAPSSNKSPKCFIAEAAPLTTSLACIFFRLRKVGRHAFRTVKQQKSQALHACFQDAEGSSFVAALRQVGSFKFSRRHRLQCPSTDQIQTLAAVQSLAAFRAFRSEDELDYSKLSPLATSISPKFAEHEDVSTGYTSTETGSHCWQTVRSMRKCLLHSTVNGLIFPWSPATGSQPTGFCSDQGNHPGLSELYFDALEASRGSTAFINLRFCIRTLRERPIRPAPLPHSPQLICAAQPD